MNITDIVNAISPLEGVTVSDVLIPEDCCLVQVKSARFGWGELHVNVVDENTVLVTPTDDEDAEPEQFHSIDDVAAYIKNQTY